MAQALEGDNMSPRLKGINIQAGWDGLQENAVKLKITIWIAAQPGTGYTILDYFHNAVELVEITSIRKMEASAGETLINQGIKHSGELSGTTLASMDGEQSPKLQASHAQPDLCLDAPCATTRRILSSGLHPMSVSPSNKIAVNECMMTEQDLLLSGGISTPHSKAQTPFIDRHISDPIISVEKLPDNQILSRLPNSTTERNSSTYRQAFREYSSMETSRVPAGCDNQKLLDDLPMACESLVPRESYFERSNEKRKAVLSTKYPESFSSSCDFYGSNNTIPSTGVLSPEEPPKILESTLDVESYIPLRDISATKKNSSQEELVLESSTTPSFTELLLPKKRRAYISTQASSLQKLQRISSKFPPLVSNNYVNGTSSSQPPGTEKNTSITISATKKATNSFEEDRCFSTERLPTGFTRSNSPASSQIETAHVEIIPGQSRRDSNLEDANSENYRRTSEINSHNVLMQASENALDEGQSPSESPRIWLRNNGLSGCFFLINPLMPLKDDAKPYSVKHNGRLDVCFPRNVELDVYEIEVEARILLLSPDPCGWQRIWIPGLRCLEVPNKHASTGTFSFCVEHSGDYKLISDVQFFSEELFHKRNLASQITGVFNLWKLPRIFVRSKPPILVIEEFLITVVVSITVSMLEHNYIEMKYHARMTFNLRNVNVFAKRIRFSLVARQSPWDNSTYYLGSGTHALTLPTDPQLSSRTKGKSATINVIRDTQDMERPLDVYFTTTHVISDFIVLTIPSLRPLKGKVHSEVVFLMESSPILTINQTLKRSFSTWKALEFREAGIRVLQFHREKLPRFFPEGLQDDLMISVSQLKTVSFRSLQNSRMYWLNENPESVARNLQLKVYKALGNTITCDLSIDVQVGSNSKVLDIYPGDWDPQYSVLDGHLATEKNGEWRLTDDYYITLFRKPDMIPSQVIHVEFSFQQYPPTDGDTEIDSDGETQNERLTEVVDTLPKIVGKTILGGSIKCELDNCKVMLVDAPDLMAQRSVRIFTGCTIKLPTLTPDHTISIRQQGSAQASNPTCSLVRKDNESEHHVMRTRRVRFLDMQEVDAREENPKLDDSKESIESIGSCDCVPILPSPREDSNQSGACISWIWTTIKAVLYMFLSVFIIEFLLSAFSEDSVSGSDPPKLELGTCNVLSKEITAIQRIVRNSQVSLLSKGKTTSAITSSKTFFGIFHDEMDESEEIAVVDTNGQPIDNTRNAITVSYSEATDAGYKGILEETDMNALVDELEHGKNPTLVARFRDFIDYALGWRGNEQ